MSGVELVPGNDIFPRQIDTVEIHAARETEEYIG